MAHGVRTDVATRSVPEPVGRSEVDTDRRPSAVPTVAEAQRRSTVVVHFGDELGCECVATEQIPPRQPRSVVGVLEPYGWKHMAEVTRECGCRRPLRIERQVPPATFDGDRARCERRLRQRCFRQAWRETHRVDERPAGLAALAGRNGRCEDVRCLLRSTERFYDGAPVIREDDVGSSDAHVDDGPGAVVRIGRRRQTERERKRILGAPTDLRDRLRITGGIDEQLVEDHLRLFGQPDHMTAISVGVRTFARERAEFLLEEEEVAFGQMADMTDQSRSGGAGRQAAVLLAPQMEREPVVLGPKRRRRHHLEDFRRSRERLSVRV
jgi:hypothetical protein